MMNYFQPYGDVPGIQDMEDGLSSGPQWAAIDPALEIMHFQSGYSSAHAYNTEQRLMSLQHSINGNGHLSPMQIPEEKMFQVELQSPWSQPDMYRNTRTVSPGCAFGSYSATESMTSDEALSPAAARHYPSNPRMASMSQQVYCSPSPQYGGGNGNWAPHTLYSNAPPSSPYAASDHSACNLKDLQYSQDVDVEERPSTIEQPHLLTPEELAFADEGLGCSIGDEESIKESDEEEEGPQPSDGDSEYSPTHRRKISSTSTTHGGPRGTPRRTRSLHITSPILNSSSAKISKPSQTHSHANHRHTISSSSSTKNPSRHASKRQARSFPCTFSHYGCPSVFGSKNEFKRHVNTQHLQLGFYRCDTGFCLPEKNNNTAAGKTPSYNDFNRKDLFTQHHRRMHVPFTGKYESATQKQKDDFDAGMEAVRARCWVTRRSAPAASTCGVCGKEFAGEGSWEERMEHVGKHFERGEGSGAGGEGEIVEDEALTAWAVEEGLVRDLGGRGKWLVGLEPGDGGIGRVGRRGRRTSAMTAMTAREEEDEEDDDDDE